MFVLGNLISAIAQILSVLFTIMTWIVIIRALLSWVNPDPYNPIVQFTNQASDLVLEPLRRVIPSWKMGLDITPIIAVLLLKYGGDFVVATLLEISFRMR